MLAIWSLELWNETSGFWVEVLVIVFACCKCIVGPQAMLAIQSLWLWIRDWWFLGLGSTVSVFASSRKLYVINFQAYENLYKTVRP